MTFCDPPTQRPPDKKYFMLHFSSISSKIHPDRTSRQSVWTPESADDCRSTSGKRVKSVLLLESWLQFGLSLSLSAFGDLSQSVCHGRLPDRVFWYLNFPQKEFRQKVDSSFVSLTVHLVIWLQLSQTVCHSRLPDFWLSPKEEFWWKVNYSLVDLSLSLGAFGDLWLELLSVTAGFQTQ